MPEPEPDADSPFAEFAAPKPSAVDYLRNRREQDARTNRRRRVLLASLSLASALGAGVGASLGTSFLAFPAAWGFAFVGSLIGLLIGWLVGSVTWASQVMQSKGYHADALAQMLVQNNSWDRLTIWLGAWGAIGTALGSAMGASKGANLVDPLVGNAAIPWAWGGALLGLVLGFGIWQILKRW